MKKTRLKKVLFKGIFWLFFYLNWIALSSCVFAQENTSFDISFRSAKSDTERVRLLNQEFLKVQYTDPPKAQEYVDRSISIAESIDYGPGLIKAYNNKANVYNEMSAYAQGLEYFEKSLVLSESINSDEGKASALNGIGATYWKLAEYTRALDNYFQALEIWETRGDSIGMSNAYMNIGIIYKLRKEFDKAIENYQKSLKIKSVKGDSTGMAMTYNNIGNVYFDQDDIEGALPYYELVLSISEAKGLKKGISVAYTNMARCFTKTRNYEIAMQYVGMAKKIQEERGNKWGVTYSLKNMGDIYNLMKNSSQAIHSYSESADLAREINADAEELSALAALAQTEASMGRYEEALGHFKHSVQLMDSLFNEDKSKEIGKLEAKHEFEKTEADRARAFEIKSQRKKAERTRRDNLQYSGILLFLVFLSGILMTTGKLALSVRLTEGLVFFTFLLLFEFTLVLLDPYIEFYSGGAPAIKLTFNAALAAMIFPLHHLFETLLKKRLLQRAN